MDKIDDYINKFKKQEKDERIINLPEDIKEFFNFNENIDLLNIDNFLIVFKNLLDYIKNNFSSLNYITLGLSDYEKSGNIEQWNNFYQLLLDVYRNNNITKKFNTFNEKSLIGYNKTGTVSSIIFVLSGGKYPIINGVTIKAIKILELDKQEAFKRKLSKLEQNKNYLNYIKLFENLLSKDIESYEELDRFFFYITTLTGELLEHKINNETIQNQPLNQILYGPPGTSKTYNTINKALEIIFEKENENNYEFKFKFDKDLKISYFDALNIKDDKKRRKILKGIFDHYVNTQIKFVTFHQSYGYEEFVEGIKAIPVGENGNEDGKEMIYKVVDGIFKKLSRKAEENLQYEYAIIIDEINRGNISKIFGELITLIEDSKRAGRDEAVEITLPYSGEKFSIPKNLYIIGTMNTADRSIALLDTALRRRFDFIEMMPKPELLENINNIENINIKSLLEIINKRIEYLYDRDHTIGHAYFMSLKENNAKTELDNIMRNKIIPLLQEYFYDDWEKIMMVLGDGFIKKEEMEVGIFNYIQEDYLEDKKNIYTVENEFDYSKFNK